MLLQQDDLRVCTRTGHSALPWGEGLFLTRELFLLAVLQALLGVSLEMGGGHLFQGVLHVPRALTPGAFALCFLLPWGQKPSAL